MILHETQVKSDEKHNGFNLEDWQLTRRVDYVRISSPTQSVWFSALHKVENNNFDKRCLQDHAGDHLSNRGRFPCFHNLIETRGGVGRIHETVAQTRDAMNE